MCPCATTALRHIIFLKNYIPNVIIVDCCESVNSPLNIQCDETVRKICVSQNFTIWTYRKYLNNKFTLPILLCGKKVDLRKLFFFLNNSTYYFVIFPINRNSILYPHALDEVSIVRFKTFAYTYYYKEIKFPS